MGEGEFCKCGCHRPGVVMMHFAPCCYTCGYCWRHVNFQAWDAHQVKCEAEAFNALTYTASTS